MQDIFPANNRPIRPQPRPLPSANRRMPEQSSAGFVVNSKESNAKPLNNIEPEKTPTYSSQRFGTRTRLLGGVVMTILVVVTYMGISNWSAVDSFIDPENVEATTLSSASEGSDETALPQNALADYKVAADLPRALYIDKINVSARVLPMGVNKDGAMQAPIGIYDSGWYTDSAKPGTAGAMLIDGHASGPTREGLFANLDRLQDGDSIELEKGDGTRLSYRVVFTEIVLLENVDMGKMLQPYGDHAQGLNLITCTGKWVKDKNTYDKRVTVYAARVE